MRYYLKKRASQYLKLAMLAVALVKDRESNFSNKLLEEYMFFLKSKSDLIIGKSKH